MALTDEEIKKIAKELGDYMTEEKRQLWIDPETHYRQHLFIKNLQERNPDPEELLEYVQSHREMMQEKEKNLKDIKKKLIGAMVVSLALGVLGTVGSYTIDFFQKISKLLQ